MVCGMLLFIIVYSVYVKIIGVFLNVLVYGLGEIFFFVLSVFYGWFFIIFFVVGSGVGILFGFIYYIGIVSLFYLIVGVNNLVCLVFLYII